MRLRALSPTTDAEVAGVRAAVWAVYGRDESEGPPLPPREPRWLPEQV